MSVSVQRATGRESLAGWIAVFLSLLFCCGAFGSVLGGLVLSSGALQDQTVENAWASDPSQVDAIHKTFEMGAGYAWINAAVRLPLSIALLGAGWILLSARREGTIVVLAALGCAALTELAFGGINAGASLVATVRHGVDGEAIVGFVLLGAWIGLKLLLTGGCAFLVLRPGGASD